MTRYEIIKIPPERERYIIIDNALDGYLIGECDSEKEATDFVSLRESQDVVHSV